jgi:hypothetical protein
MGNKFDIFGIVSAITIILGLTLNGIITPSAAALLIVLSAVLIAFSKSLARILFGVVSLCMLIWAFSGGNLNDFIKLFVSLLPVIIPAMFLTYVLINLISPNKSK